MGILKRDNDKKALTRSEQTQMNPYQLMRDMMIDPFRAFQQWGDFGNRDLVMNPSFEVRETDDALILKGDMPGIRQEDLEISLVGNNLQISGKRERDEQHEEGTMHTYERSFGQFTRSCRPGALRPQGRRADARRAEEGGHRAASPQDPDRVGFEGLTERRRRVTQAVTDIDHRGRPRGRYSDRAGKTDHRRGCAVDRSGGVRRTCVRTLRNDARFSSADTGRVA
jgi:HSP20 family molecular chaperone IbpA